MTLAIWPRLVAFKDRLVEAYIRGMAAEQAERHQVPPLGTCALCGRPVDYAMKEYERGAANERRIWVEALKMERAQWRIEERPGAGYVRGALDCVVSRLGIVGTNNSHRGQS